MTITCNIYGNQQFRPQAQGANTGTICSRCTSSVRMRRIAMAISKYVFKSPKPLYKLDGQPLDIVGLSDFYGYANVLEKVSNYTNTFYHKEPYLDITKPDDKFSNLDCLIASDVFEHIPPPVSHAFSGAYSIIKEGGLLIVSMPLLADDQIQTIEHYPRLNKHKIIEIDGDYYLLNKTKGGFLEIYSGLRFHGGPGATLEYRIFSKSHVEEELRKSGFCQFFIFDVEFPEFEIANSKGISTVYIAQK